MNSKDFQRIFNNFLNKAEFKNVDFSSLTREEKINHLASKLDFDSTGVILSSVKEMEISKLSKDLRFQLIQTAASSANMELVQALASNSGVVSVPVSVEFDKASIAAQLSHLEKEYISRFGSLPTDVEVDILGGENFKKFVEFAHNMLNA